MKTYKCCTCNWREEVMKALGLAYTISKGMIVYKGSIAPYSTLVEMLIEKRIELGIKSH